VTSIPIMPMNTDKYLADTTHLNTEEHGAYILLLMVAWRTAGAALPDDDELLARYARMNARGWAKIKVRVMAFWDLSDGLWTQKTQQNVRGIVEKNIEAKRKNGKRGGRPKSLKDNDSQEASGSRPETDKKTTYTNTNTNTSSLCSDEIGAAKPTPRSELETTLDPVHAQAVVEHRQRLRRPLTAHAAALLAKRLAEFDDPNAAADLMIEKGWQSIEAGWGESRPPSRASPRTNDLSDAFGVLDQLSRGQNGPNDITPDEGTVRYLPSAAR